MTNTLIVSGGRINNNLFEKIIKHNIFDIIIASDSGLEILNKFKINPNYIIGDFDSVDKSILKKYINNDKIKIIKLKPEKDFTDTHMAIKLAIKKKSTDITILGAIGTRIDHTLANINILKEPLEQNIPCRIINEKNNIILINKNTILEKDPEYPYISLIPLTNIVEDVTLEGFKYTLNKSTLRIGESIGISNEQIDKKGIIKLNNGILIVIKSKD